MQFWGKARWQYVGGPASSYVAPPTIGVKIESFHICEGVAAPPDYACGWYGYSENSIFGKIIEYLPGIAVTCYHNPCHAGFGNKISVNG